MALCMDVSHVAVIGAGTMGAGIAQVFLQNEYRVTLIDQDQDALHDAETRISNGLGTLVDNGVLSAYESTQFMEDDLTVATSLEAVEEADLIIEAVPEQLDVKQQVFAAAASHNPEAVYASNTSSIPIAKIADAIPDPGKCVGFHFFNPVPVIPLVEIVETNATQPAVLDTVKHVAERLEKEYVVVQDRPGFISNRILFPFINEAVKALEQEAASKEDIDTVAETGFNHPMGPLQLADFIGLDVCLHILQTLHEYTGEDQYRPATLLKEKVDENKLGRKTGTGFYTYDEA